MVAHDFESRVAKSFTALCRQFPNLNSRNIRQYVGYNTGNILQYGRVRKECIIDPKEFYIMVHRGMEEATQDVLEGGIALALANIERETRRFIGMIDSLVKDFLPSYGLIVENSIMGSLEQKQLYEQAKLFLEVGKLNRGRSF